MRRNALVMLVALLIAHRAAAFLSVVRQGQESADTPEANDLFGRELCAGDFDDDGWDDLAAAAPDEANGSINTAAHGNVVISPGSARGISSAGAYEIHVGDLGTDAARFGWSMVAADFDQDGYCDLAVAAPQYDTLSGTDQGAVWVFAGGPSGLQGSPYLEILYDDAEPMPTALARFGWDLTSGDFNDDNFPDLAIGAIGHGGNTGAIYFLYGSQTSGLTTAVVDKLSPGSVGGPESAGSWFGHAIAAGQLDGIGGDDIFIGAPRTTVGGLAQAGRVYFYYSDGTRISDAGAWYLDNSNFGAGQFSGTAQLGFSVGVGHLYQSSGLMDVVAGAPTEGTGLVNHAGALLFVEFDSSPTVPDTKQKVTQIPTAGSPGRSIGDQFGYTIAIGKFDGDQIEDVAASAPYEDREEDPLLGDQLDAGVVHMLYGGSNGPTTSGGDLYDANTFNNYLYANDNFGLGLCFGNFDNDSREVLTVGAPGSEFRSYEDGVPDIANAGQVHIYAPWRQPTDRPHRSSVLFDCDGFILYGQRPFDRVRPASSTKALTLLLACEAIANGSIDPEQLYEVPFWAANGPGGSLTPLVEGEKLRFKGLMQTMMTVSGNDSAMLIGTILSGTSGPSWLGFAAMDPTFAAMMEARATQLGLSSDVSLTNAAGVDDGDHYVTALDWATLAYLIIQNPCVKQIVNKSPWIVERVLPAGTTLDWFGFGGGGPAGTVRMFEAFFAGWVDGLKAMYPKAVGIKPGSTPGGLGTGISAAFNPFGSEHSAASSFGSRLKNEPIEGVAGGCSNCLHAELLQFAQGYCPDNTPVIFTPIPGLGPQPWATLTNIPVCTDTPIQGVTINLTEEQRYPATDVVMWDVMRKGPINSSASTKQMIRRRSEIRLPGFGTFASSIAPHDENLGGEISNIGSAPVNFNLFWGGVEAAGLSLNPGESLSLGGGVSIGSNFQLTIQSTQATEAILLLHELGHVVQYSLYQTASANYNQHGTLTSRSGHLLLTESTTLYVMARPGGFICDSTLDVVAREDSSTPTTVREEIPTNESAGLHLEHIAPNPFNPRTVVRFALTLGASVDIRIYDVRGRLVRTLRSGRHFRPGSHEVSWDGTDDLGQAVASGVYSVRLTADGVDRVQQVTLLK